MKKLFITLAFITPLVSFAQVEKGMFLVSGNVSFQKNLSDNQAMAPTSAIVKQFDVMPYFGYMVSSRLAIGIVADYSSFEQNFDAPQNQVSVIRTNLDFYNVGLFVRYYHPITGKFFFFAQGDVSYGKGTQSALLPAVIDTPKADIKGATIAVRPGITYFVSKRWAVELIMGSIKYGTREQKSNGQTINKDGFAFNFLTRGLSPGVVFTF
jgi:hypothetical protein